MRKSLQQILLLTCVMCFAVLIVFAMIWPDVQVKEGTLSIEAIDGNINVIQEYDVFYKDTKLDFYSWEERRFVGKAPAFLEEGR